MASPVLLYLRRFFERDVRLLRVVWEVVRQWRRDRPSRQAAALAYHTALAVVPVCAVAFGLLHMTGALAARSALVEFVSTRLIPASGGQIAGHIVGFAERSAGAIGLVGTGVTVLLAYWLFVHVDDVWNDVWRVKRRRGFLTRFPVFYTVATLAPAGLGLSLYYTARWQQGAGGLLSSLALTFVALLLMNRVLPGTGVRWRSAAVGALVSTVLFEAAKLAFSLYVSRLLLDRAFAVYGALGLVPIFLIWVYWSWLVLLLGAQVSYTVQNFETLQTVPDTLMIGARPSAQDATAGPSDPTPTSPDRASGTLRLGR